MTKIVFSGICNKMITLRIVAWLVIVFFISPVAADTLKVAASWAKPPYIIPKTHSGFEIELMTDVFKDLGHDVNFMYMPYGRAVEMLAREQIDVTLTLNNLSGIAPKQLSEVYVFYQNVALSLKSKHLLLQQLQDLSKYSVAGFQSASEVLGSEFAAAVKDNPFYTEIADQKRQLELLLDDQVDVIIIDLNVFNYLAFELTGFNQFENVTVHPFFPLSPYSAGFKDMLLKANFNRSLGKYVSSGRYQALREKYNFKDIIPFSINQ